MTWVESNIAECSVVDSRSNVDGPYAWAHVSVSRSFAERVLAPTFGALSDLCWRCVSHPLIGQSVIPLTYISPTSRPGVSGDLYKCPTLNPVKCEVPSVVRVRVLTRIPLGFQTQARAPHFLFLSWGSEVFHKRTPVALLKALMPPITGTSKKSSTSVSDSKKWHVPFSAIDPP